MEQQQFLSASELSRLSGRNEKTIRRAILAGRLPAETDAETGAYRIPRDAGLKLYPARQNGQDHAEAADEPALPNGSPSVVQRTLAEQVGELRGVLGALRSLLDLPSLDDQHFREVCRGVLAGREV